MTAYLTSGDGPCSKAPTPLKTPVEWRLNPKRSHECERGTQECVRHGVFITFGGPAGPWKLPYGRGSVALDRNRAASISDRLQMVR